MKKIALAAAVSMAATSAFAGNIVEPVVEPVVVVEETRTSSINPGILVPLLVLAVAAAIGLQD